jgi:hypothetical protein
MIQAIANEPRPFRLRGTRTWLVTLLFSIELVNATAFGQTNDKAQEGKPAQAEPAQAKPSQSESPQATQEATATGAGANAAVTPAPAGETKPADSKPTEGTSTAAASSATVGAGATAVDGATPETSEELDPEMLPVPGSPRPYGMGMSADAPAVPATTGGRAMAFGAPGPKGSEWSFRFGGRIAGFENFGIGRKPSPLPEGYSGTPIHMPALMVGRGAIWSGAGLTLNLTYGNPVITANITYWVNLNGSERRGYYSPQSGPSSGQAYLALTPPKLGKLQLASKVGVFTEMHGGVGQWGWGIFGPLLATRGFGESIVGEIPLTGDYRLWFSHGLSGVPSIQENTPRGDYSGWIEPAKSSLVLHEHIGINFRGTHGIRLHHTRIWGTDERQTLDNDLLLASKRDGHMDVYLFDIRTRQDPYGHFAVAGALYDLKNGKAINDGIWWGIDWTQGASQQIEKFLGTQGNGTGRYGVLSAQWDFSLARILWHPRNFDGRHPDLRGGIAGMVHKTFSTDDALYKGAKGYLLGIEAEYVFLPWIGLFTRSYSENRDYRTWAYGPDQTFARGELHKFTVFSVMPGIIIRSDWASTDSIQIAYQRRWYGRYTDNNPAAPLDRDIITIGATAQF